MQSTADEEIVNLAPRPGFQTVYYTLEQLEQDSPSRKDGIPTEKEELFKSSMHRFLFRIAFDEQKGLKM